MKLYKCFFKRIFDLVISIIALILSFPILLVVLSALKLINKAEGVFFVQERSGKKGRIFKILKLRTMCEKVDNEGNLLPDIERLTRIGKFLRSKSLDEIPQLINVLKGDMSLIGPRPLLPQYLPLYSKDQARRHEVRPGITGWAQVNGRNASKFSVRFEYDIWYIDHLSFKLDMLIILKTIGKVISSEGVYTAQIPTDIMDFKSKS
jgi:undecaprenyl phosphate N,N'-diacetylbacillosamine 1-phosphate transferase